MNIFKSNIEKLKKIINNNKSESKESKIDQAKKQEEEKNKEIKEKKVRIIDENNQEQEVKQFCQHITQNNMVLLAENKYEQANKIYHTYLDCYEDWSDTLKAKFQGWKVKDKGKLENYKKCARCQEREYKESHPNAKITGYSFHYYYEDL